MLRPDEQDYDVFPKIHCTPFARRGKALRLQPEHASFVLTASRQSAAASDWTATAMSRLGKKDNSKAHSDSLAQWQGELMSLRQDMEHFQDKIKAQLDSTWQAIQESIAQSSHVLDRKMQSQLDKLEAAFMDKLAKQQDKIEQQDREIARLQIVVATLSAKSRIQTISAPIDIPGRDPHEDRPLSIAIDNPDEYSYSPLNQKRSSRLWAEFSDNVAISPSSSAPSDRKDLASSPRSFLRHTGKPLRSPASLDTLSEHSSHSPFAFSPALDLPPLPNSASDKAPSAPHSHASSKIQLISPSKFPLSLSPGTYHSERAISKDPDTSQIVEEESHEESDPHDFIPLIASPMADTSTIPLALTRRDGLASSRPSPTPNTSTTSPMQDSHTVVTDAASTLVSDMVSLAIPSSPDVHPVVADAARRLAIACTPLFQQALKQIFDYARSTADSDAG